MSENSVDARVIPQRWEYFSEQLDRLDELEMVLNHTGEQSWELVNVLPNNGAWMAVYKRPVKLLAAGHVPVPGRVARAMPQKPR